MKRPNHSGTVYKLKGKRRRPYVALSPATHDINGSMVKGKPIGYFRTKSEAVECLNRFLVLPYDRSVSVEDVYQIIKKEQFSSLTKSTAENYEYCHQYLQPLANRKLADLKTADLQMCLNLIDSPSMQYKVKCLLHKIYKYAMQNDIVYKNYSDYITEAKSVPKEKKPFTDDEILRMFDHCDDPDVQSVLILIYTGYRITEFLTRTHDDIDMDNLVIYGGNKTASGRKKIVPIHPFIVDFVKARYDSGAEYPFGNLDASNFRKRNYARALKLCDIEYRSPHTCRHTFAQMLNRTSSPNELQVSRLLGHSKYKTTADWYTTPQIEELRNELNKI